MGSGAVATARMRVKQERVRPPIPWVRMGDFGGQKHLLGIETGPGGLKSGTFPALVICFQSLPGIDGKIIFFLRTRSQICPNPADEDAERSSPQGYSHIGRGIAAPETSR